MADDPVSVFISYSRTDSAFIDRLEADLRAYGFETWVDRQHLEGGADWARVIEQRILDHESFIIALSPEAVVSEWVRKELAFALATGRHIIPIIARPVERLPIEIANIQYTDLSANYADHLQDVRVALLKTREAPPVPRPPAPPKPLLAPDLSDPLKGLVEIPAAPPPLNPDLSDAFMQARSALAHGSLDLAEALLGQITDVDPGFGHGLAAEDLARVRQQLAPIQIDRLQRLASDAHTRGAWGEEIGALRALASRKPDDEVIPVRLEIAEECQKWSYLYAFAQAAARNGDVAAVSANLTSLWEKAPNYGDPARIAPSGLRVPAPTGAPTSRSHTLIQGYTILTLAAHTDQVNALRWSADGTRLATAGADNGARIWSARDGKILLDYSGHTAPVNDITWLPKGDSLASAADDGSVRVWGARDGKVVFTLYPGVTDVRSVDAHPRGEDLIAGGSNPNNLPDRPIPSVVCKWSLQTGTESARLDRTSADSLFNHLSYYDAERRDLAAAVRNLFDAYTSRLACARWSPDGSRIAVGISSYCLILPPHDLQAETAINAKHPVLALAWDPSATQLAVATDDGMLSVVRRDGENWAYGTHQVFSCGGHAGPVTAVTWSAAGNRIATGSADGVRLWDAANGRLLYNYTAHDAAITAVAFSPDSARVASGDAFGHVHIWKA